MNRWNTIAFDEDFMRKTIGIGEPIFNPEFVGFDVKANPCSLNVDVWLSFVPEVYREQTMEGVRVTGERFINTKADYKLVPLFVAALRSWIEANVEPR